MVITVADLHLINTALFLVVGAHLLLLGSSALWVRLVYPNAWIDFKHRLRTRTLSTNLPAYLREAAGSNPDACTNTVLRVSLVVAEILLYPAGLLFLAYVLLAITRNTGG
jgi:hypothetical protein